MQQKELRAPLLLALGRLGGAPSKTEALSVVELLVLERLQPDDWVLMTNGEPRWQNLTAWERNDLLKAGLVLNERRNEWLLSEAGWREYERLEEETLVEEQPVSAMRSPTGNFKPKDDVEYVARLSKTVQVKSRAHETLVNAFADWLQKRGVAVSNPDYQDLLVTSSRREWIVEAKVLYFGDARSAARDALSQLFDYRYFLHEDDPAVRLVALFSEDIGVGYEGYLAAHGVESVCVRSGAYVSNCADDTSIFRARS